MKSTIELLAAVVVLSCFISACDRPPIRTDAAPTRDSAIMTAKEVRGVTPYAEIQNEPAARLIVDPPLPNRLAQGVVLIQWRAENVHIAPVFGKGALDVSPRVGHLHIQVDDLPWWWADPGNINTIDMAGLPPGRHKVKISLMNANHELFPGQSRIVSFTIPERSGSSHSH
jgi:Family of unknown function (DUF6130)